MPASRRRGGLSRAAVAAVAMLAVAACSLQPAANRTASPGDTHAERPATLHVERIVMLLRHGVRPPTRPVVVPVGYAQDPWPTWTTPLGHLTAHGYQAAVLVGAWDRSALAVQGVVPKEGCPAAGSVVVWADTDERTVKTGEAFLQGFAPGCGVVVGHANGDRDDPLFAPVATRAVPYDPGQARAAVMARVHGDLKSVMPPLAAAFARLGAILRCCAPPVCAAAGLPAGCSLAALPEIWEKPRAVTRVKFLGPITYGSTAAQTILMQYLDDMPMQDVGWGRLKPGDIELLSTIHVAEFDLLARTRYIANRQATPIMQRVLDEFGAAAAPSLTVLVGHDTNVANVGGMLGLHWHVPGYAADDPVVTGALGFELLRDTRGRRYVRVFYQGPTPQQVRSLQKLDASHAPYLAYLPQPLCGMPDDATLCSEAAFRQQVAARLVH